MERDSNSNYHEVILVGVKYLTLRREYKDFSD